MAKKTGITLPKAQKMRGEAHEYDSNRPKKPVVSRYAK